MSASPEPLPAEAGRPNPGPTGKQYEITAGGYRAVISELGAALRSLSRDGADLIHGFGADDTIDGGRGQQLIPWPNRLRDGHYVFDGVDQQLPLSEPDRHNASHGLVRWAGWRLVGQEESEVRLAFTLFPQKGWASVVDCELGYRVSSDGLEVEVSAHNVGDHRVPFGYGAHPYLTAGESSVDELTLSVPAASFLQVDERLLPAELVALDQTYDFRTARPIGDQALDTAFSDLDRDERGRWQVSIECRSRRTTLWADEQHHWTQVFTGKRRDTGLAVEPMTCGPDAFNPGPTRTGLVALEPGESYHGRWGIFGS